MPLPFCQHPRAQWGRRPMGGGKKEWKLWPCRRTGGQAGRRDTFATAHSTFSLQHANGEPVGRLNNAAPSQAYSPNTGPLSGRTGDRKRLIPRDGTASALTVRPNGPYSLCSASDGSSRRRAIAIEGCHRATAHAHRSSQVARNISVAA